MAATNSAHKCRYIRNVAFIFFNFICVLSLFCPSTWDIFFVISGLPISPRIVCKFQDDNILLPGCQAGYGCPLLCIHGSTHKRGPLTAPVPSVHSHDGCTLPYYSIVLPSPIYGLVLPLLQHQEFENSSGIPAPPRSVGSFVCSHSERLQTTLSRHPPWPSLPWSPSSLPSFPERGCAGSPSHPQARPRLPALSADAGSFLSSPISLLAHVCLWRQESFQM